MCNIILQNFLVFYRLKLPGGDTIAIQQSASRSLISFCGIPCFTLVASMKILFPCQSPVTVLSIETDSMDQWISIEILLFLQWKYCYFVNFLLIETDSMDFNANYFVPSMVPLIEILLQCSIVNFLSTMPVPVLSI